jgi:sortase A
MPFNTGIARQSGGSFLRAAQWLAFTAGVALLSIYTIAEVHAAMSSRLALWAFSAAQASRSGQAPARNVALPDNESSFSLWPDTRIEAYRADFARRIALPAATLSIARLGLRAPVFEGVDAITLNRGLGRIPGTAEFGEAGNIGIAGHRDAFFRPLKDIVPGDSIEVATPTSRDMYVVDRIEIVNPSDVEVLGPQSKPALTLVTCYPFYFVGSAPRRFVVQALLRSGTPQARLHSTQ